MKIVFSFLFIVLLFTEIGMLCFSIVYDSPLFFFSFSKIVVFLFKFFFIVENEGLMKVVEGKICDVKLYDYCDENCYNDCPKIYGAKAIGFCNFNPQVCICRRKC